MSASKEDHYRETLLCDIESLSKLKGYWIDVLPSAFGKILYHGIKKKCIEIVVVENLNTIYIYLPIQGSKLPIDICQGLKSAIIEDKIKQYIPEIIDYAGMSCLSNIFTEDWYKHLSTFELKIQTYNE